VKFLLILVSLLCTVAGEPATVTPTTGQFIGALSTCALNLKITLSSNLIGSIKSLYEGEVTKGNAVLEQETDFLNLFAESDRKAAFDLYSICVQSVLDPSHFDPFILNKIVVDKTNISFVKQRLGDPNTDEPSEVGKGNVATFPVGGYIIRIYYFPKSINGKDIESDENAVDVHFDAGTVAAISVSTNPDEAQKPLVLEGYWVWFGCDPGETCATWGSRKQLGSIKLSELAGDECNPMVTGQWVGWNQQPDRMVLFCSGNHGASAAFSCGLPEKIGTMSDILYHRQEIAKQKADGDDDASSEEEVINNVKSDFAVAESTYKTFFWSEMKNCTVLEYAIVGDGISLDALFVGNFSLDFQN
jgi:hypothetical protein